MFSKFRTILALAPGKREFGIAVFKRADLTFFVLKTFRRSRDGLTLRREISELLQGLISSFKPDVVVIRSVSQYQRASKNLLTIHRVLRHGLTTPGISLIEVTLEDIKTILGDGAKPTQRKAFRHLSILYPELRRYLDRPNKWQKEYYNNLLSAVAVGVVVLNSKNRYSRH